MPNYDLWNELLAKKWATMFKHYQKFKQRFFKPVEQKIEERNGVKVTHDVQLNLLNSSQTGSSIFRKFEHDQSL